MKLILNTEIHAYTHFLPVTISAQCDSRLHASGNKISFYTFASHINYWWQSVWHFTNGAHTFTKQEINYRFQNCLTSITIPPIYLDFVDMQWPCTVLLMYPYLCNNFRQLNILINTHEIYQMCTVNQELSIWADVPDLTISSVNYCINDQQFKSVQYRHLWLGGLNWLQQNRTLNRTVICMETSL